MTISARDISPLTLDRAKAINSAMLNMALEREGLRKVPLDQITLLRETSLIDMVRAGAVVKDAEEAAHAALPPGSTRSVSMVCDDRLVAAIYAFINFSLPPASSPDDEDYVIMKITDTAHHWFLVSGCRPIRTEEEPDEA